MKNNAVVTVILVVVAASAGFFGGMKYQQGKQQNFSAMFNGAGGTRGFNGANSQFQGRSRMGGAAGSRQVAGKVISQDASSVTVELPDGSSRIVLFSDKTAFNKTQSGSKGDIKTGETIAVFGTVNSDGSVSADNVQINPAFRGINGTPSPSPAK